MAETRIDLQITSIETHSIDNKKMLTQPGRLVVVLQDAEHEAVLATRILELARARGLGILLVGVVPNQEADSELRRKLARVAAFLREAPRTQTGPLGQVSVEVHIERGRGWLSGLRCILQPGDMLACLETGAGVLHRPLSDVLGAGLQLPVYVFSDLSEPRVEGHTILRQVGAWVGSLASVAGFMLVSVRIVLATQGAAQSVLLLVAVGLAISVIYTVNSLFGAY